MKMKRRWHDFLCWLFRHRWEYIECEEPEFIISLVAWRFCKRCGKAEYLGLQPPQHPNCRCVLIPEVNEKKKIRIIEKFTLTGFSLNKDGSIGFEGFIEKEREEEEK